ncbi:hypothetical protein L3X38_003196 [Prunus dulcis]|uniref:Uncharacterized protein n=1 Tax=Prunus dulcis TaxID=3755 RepID=A0AAD4ZLL3_PRUDU|nr:hypothetical protein L3X38_003196 [Prunus dulcis]
MNDFHRFVSDCHMLDLRYEGYPYISRNQREGGGIHERLDRGFANDHWLRIYPEAQVVYQGNKIKRLEKDLKTELQKEEQYWKLKSRVEWLQEGDKNTKFFHSKTVSRRRINRLHGLEDQGGIWYGEEYDIKRIVESYFQDLFTSANPVGIDEILECVHAIVSFQDNISLSKPILANEVVAAVKQLNPSKSSGLD